MTEPVFLAYQQRAVTDKAPVVVHVKCRRAGISWTYAGIAALDTSETGRGNVYYMSYAKDMTRQFIEDCGDWARYFQIAASDVEEVVLHDPDKDILAYQIRFDSGRMVMALSSSPRQLRSKGKPGDVAILDEFAFVDDQAELLKAALAFIMWGGRVIIISTHNGEDNPFNQLVDDIKSGKRPYSLHEITLDEAIADGLYRRIAMRTGKTWSPEAEATWRQRLVDFYGDDADEELFCIPSKGNGVVFTRPMVKAVMQADVPVIEWSRPEKWEELPEHIRRAECEEFCNDSLAPLLASLPKKPHWFGEDFGRSQNLTVIWPGHQTEDTSIRVPFAVELFNIPFRQQEQILFFILDHLPQFAGGAMDARGNGQALGEYTMQRYGEDRIRRIMLSDKFYLEWFPRYRAAIADRAFLIPENDGVMDDHRAVKKIKGIMKIDDTQKPSGKMKRHGDSAIAGLMLNHAVEEIPYYGSIPEVSSARPDVIGTIANGYSTGRIDWSAY